jgi:hypothetical protein
MRPSRYWILYAVCSLVWLALALLIAPSFSGEDVYFFRDAGWNLASLGLFKSAALPSMHDLIPRFYAHYTPAVPLLFAGYASVFPRNAYAGTVFNLLLGLLATAVALWGILRHPAGKLREIVAWAVAILSPVFITMDRPEALALVFFSLTIALGTRRTPRPLLAGLLITLTFLTHPFAAVIASVWTLVLFLSLNWNCPQRWLMTLRQLAIMMASIIVALTPVIVLYHFFDRNSLVRFLGHAFGIDSGLGVALTVRSSRDFLHKLSEALLTSFFVTRVKVCGSTLTTST